MIIPFFIPHAGCPHHCVFCDQKKITGQNTQPDPALLAAKIEKYLLANHSNEPAQIAFYGGTFTALPLGLQRSYLEPAQAFISQGRIGSIRLSTRPDSITLPVLQLLKKHRVSVIELGAQTMTDAALTLSGRGHSADDTEKAVGLLRQFSFTIGLQLMPGLPGETPDSFHSTVEKTIMLRPDFVRLYPALVIKDTPLEELYRSGQYAPLGMREAIDICKEALLRYVNEGIDVIRIGLQPTEELEKPGTIIAGPYHPAFRQMVESSIMLDRMRAALSNRKDRFETARITVHRDDLSNAIGQKRSNIEALKREFCLTQLLLQTNDSVARRTVRMAQ